MMNANDTAVKETKSSLPSRLEPAKSRRWLAEVKDPDGTWSLHWANRAPGEGIAYETPPAALGLKSRREARETRAMLLGPKDATVEHI